MVEAGEAAGILDIVLDRVALQIEKEEPIKRRVKGAMVYPTMVLVFATLVLIGMLMFLVPIFVKDLHAAQRPAADADAVRRRRRRTCCGAYWFIVFPVIARGHLRLLPRGRRRRAAARSGTGFKLRMPMKIGDTVLKVTMARFSRTLSTLVAAGVDIIKALEITGQTAGNWVVEEALAGVAPKVHEGVPIAQPLIENPVFPPMVSQMVQIGEETGELEKMLTKIADFYEDEVDASIAVAHLDHRADHDDRRRDDGRRDPASRCTCRCSRCSTLVSNSGG